MVIIQSIQGIFSIIILISIGYFLAYKKWFTEETSKLISKLVTKIAIPAYMVQNLVTTFNKDMLIKLSSGLKIPFLSIMICILLSILVCKILKVEKGRRGAFKVMFFTSNTIFIGLPVNLALFGESSVPYVLLYYIANTVIFWTIGVYLISKDSSVEEANIINFQSIKRIFSAPLIGFLLGIIFVLLEINLPTFIIDACKYLGNLTTPLSMLFIGSTIYSVDLKGIRLTKDIITIVIARLFISPFVVVLLAHFSSEPILMKEVFIIQASLPIMTQTTIISKQYNSDYKYVAVLTTLTTILSLITIPVYMFILEKIQFFIV
ncbi:AEC family transporter [Clostridium intestinale]|uniref:Auxin efflux carrier family protein n=1 Tax=Clostridium intestinale URNW TaxID=1294142 RepID=U2NS18_9CLOT|nr:AEC family transporter [Clostridium intestinale]ERK31646.1 auxin efflux carrier family protein [Clostridium intestinale URNW]